MSKQAAEVILKISERCNLGCSYCYFFERSDQSFRRHPARLDMTVARQVADFIAEGCRELDLGFVRIDLHGGEPLLVGKRHFSELCSLFETTLRPIVKLEITVQTNAVLVDEEWVALFGRHRVNVGVSLDGPPDINDRYRLDLLGRSSYQRSAKGIRLLRAAGSADHPALNAGLLCVIDPSTDARGIYRHFVERLGLRRLDFLLPNATHDDVLGYSQAELGHYLCELFDVWIESDGPRAVRLRFVESVVAGLLGEEPRLFGVGPDGHVLVTIASDGSLSPDDTLRSCGESIMNTGLSVRDVSFREFLESAQIRRLEQARVSACETCQTCAWYRACGGGFLVNRYSGAHEFANPSVHCEAIRQLLTHISRSLLSSGMNIDELCTNLGLHAKANY
jgi:uncharacterized protein